MELIQQMDSSVLLWIQENLRSAAGNGFFTVVTRLGDAGWIWIAFTVILLCRKKTRRLGLAMAIALIVCQVVNNWGIKELVERPRPHTALEQLMPLMLPPDPHSFPSGHSCSSLAAATVLMQGMRSRWKWAFLLLAVLIAFSRLYVGVHYPTDVIVGAAIGVVDGLVVWHFLKPKEQLE